MLETDDVTMKSNGGKAKIKQAERDQSYSGSVAGWLPYGRKYQMGQKGASSGEASNLI